MIIARIVTDCVTCQFRSFLLYRVYIWHTLPTLYYCANILLYYQSLNASIHTCTCQLKWTQAGDV